MSRASGSTVTPSVKRSPPATPPAVLTMTASSSAEAGPGQRTRSGPSSRRRERRVTPALARTASTMLPTARFAANVQATSATACPTFAPLSSSQPNPGPLRRAMQAALKPDMTSKAERSNRHCAFERRLVHRVTAAGIDDRAAIHHREMVPQLAREVEILLDQYHGDPPEIAQIGDGALLLLAAGEIAAAPAQHVVEHRKQREHVVGDRAILALERREAGLEVLLDGEERKDFTPLRHVGDTAPRALAGPEPGNVGAVERDRTLADRMLSGERVEQARLADAVAPQHAGDLARFGGERHVAQRLRRAVMQIDRVDMQHRASAPDKPRPRARSPRPGRSCLPPAPSLRAGR